MDQCTMRPLGPRCMAAVVAMIVLVAAGAGHATTVVALPEPVLVARSQAIGLGVVLATHFETTATGSVVTRAAVQVLRPLYGLTVGEIITVQVPGGEIAGGRLVARTSGAPRLQPGELVFGFFERVAGTHRPLGLSYGLHQIRLDARGGYLVQRNIAELRLVDALGKPVVNDAPVTEQPLAEFITRIEALVAAAHKMPSAPTPSAQTPSAQKTPSAPTPSAGEAEQP